MRIINKKEVGFLLIIVAGFLAFGYCDRYWDNKTMVERFTSGIFSEEFDPDNPDHWVSTIVVLEKRLKEIESPDYKEREQQRMKEEGTDITVTDNMIDKSYMETKKELEFAKKQLKRLSE